MGAFFKDQGAYVLVYAGIVKLLTSASVPESLAAGLAIATGSAATTAQTTREPAAFLGGAMLTTIMATVPSSTPK